MQKPNFLLLQLKQLDIILFPFLEKIFQNISYKSNVKKKIRLNSQVFISFLENIGIFYNI